MALSRARHVWRGAGEERVHLVGEPLQNAAVQPSLVELMASGTGSRPRRTNRSRGLRSRSPTIAPQPPATSVGLKPLLEPDDWPLVRSPKTGLGTSSWPAPLPRALAQGQSSRATFRNCRA